MQERRKLSRFRLIHYLTIFDREANRLIGNLVDVSPDGIAILTETPMEPGTVKHLRMTFPEEILARQYMEFDAQVVWSKVDINPDLYAVGLKLLDTSVPDQQVIYELIAEYRD